MWRVRGSGTALVEACCRQRHGRLGLARAPTGVPLLASRRLLLSSAAGESTRIGGPAATRLHLQHRQSYPYPFQRARFSTKPNDDGQGSPASAAAAEPAEPALTTAAEGGEAAAAAAAKAGDETDEGEKEAAPLFSSPSPRFFRLLAGASLTQIAFWTSYSLLPPELGSNLGYWGIAASGAFCFIARHFALHYVWEVDAVSPVAFKFAGHTFWGNRGQEHVVQVGTTKMQQTTRYIAFKVKDDAFWYLLDIKEGKFKNDEAKEQLTRMFMGLRPEGLDRVGEQGDEAGGAGGAGGRGAGGGRRWQGWKAKK